MILQDIIEGYKRGNQARHTQILNNILRKGDPQAKYTWEEFWTNFDTLFERGMYDAMELFVKINWNVNWVNPTMGGELAK